MTVDLCLPALQMALLRRNPKAGLILHSDRGSQYWAKVYQKRLKKRASLLQCHAVVIVTTMRLWKASGVRSKMN